MDVEDTSGPAKSKPERRCVVRPLHSNSRS